MSLQADKKRFIRARAQRDAESSHTRLPVACSNQKHRNTKAAKLELIKMCVNPRLFRSGNFISIDLNQFVIYDGKVEKPAPVCWSLTLKSLFKSLEDINHSFAGLSFFLSWVLLLTLWNNHNIMKILFKYYPDKFSWPKIFLRGKFVKLWNL